VRDKPLVFVFPEIFVCLNCGKSEFAEEFSVPENELRLLTNRDAAGARMNRDLQNKTRVSVARRKSTIEIARLFRRGHSMLEGECKISRYALLAEVCEGGAQRGARDSNDTRIGSVHLHNQEDRTGNRDCGGKEADNHSRVAGSEQAKADENNGQP